MPFFDMPIGDLRTYRPDLHEPDDLDAFWSETLSESRNRATGPVTQTLIDSPMRQTEVRDLRVPGFGGDEVAAWMVAPRGLSAPLPTVVEFVGYSGGRGYPHQRLAWVASGYIHVVVDNRGQGWGWSPGATPDTHGSAPSVPGVMTRGIEHPETYYYRRAFTDAVLATEAVAALPQVDATRLAVIGGSQGGGIATAVASLSAAPAALIADVPFLAHFGRAVGLTGAEPYEEIATYLRAYPARVSQVFRTLSYFDTAVLATRANAPGLFSTALQDETCPPSTVFALANRYGGQSEVDVYEFNKHEGGGEGRWPRAIGWLEQTWAAVSPPNPAR